VVTFHFDLCALSCRVTWSPLSIEAYTHKIKLEVAYWWGKIIHFQSKLFGQYKTIILEFLIQIVGFKFEKNQ